MDNTPQLRINSYRLCETSQVNEVPGRGLTRVKIGSDRLGFSGEHQCGRMLHSRPHSCRTRAASRVRWARSGALVAAREASAYAPSVQQQRTHLGQGQAAIGQTGE
jgi:hypothetical protein